jgi:hypothetical protein
MGDRGVPHVNLCPRTSVAMRLIGSELGSWALIGGTWVPGTAPPDPGYRRIGYRCKGANASVIRARDRRFG